jgi:hypothetical protein
MCYLCDQLAKSRFMHTLCQRLAIEDSFWLVVVISSFRVRRSMSLLDPIGFFFCMFTVIYQACLIVIGSFMLQLSICPRSVWDIIWLIGIWLIGSWSISPKMGGKVASNEHIWPMWGFIGVPKFVSLHQLWTLKLISHQYYKFLVLGTSFYSNL